MVGETAPGSRTEREGWTESPDGTRLFWRAAVPASPSSVVVIAHGLAEHVGRYDHVLGFLAGHGHATYAGDFRGHGRSSGPRVHVASFDEFVLDLRTVQDLAAAAHPGLPRFVAGHSQGGLVTLLHALRHPHEMDGIVVSSPYLAVHPEAAASALRLLAASALFRLAPSHLVSTGLQTSALSHDPEVEKAYVADPLVSRKVSSAWFRAAQDAQEEVLAGAPLLAVPAMVMLAGDDRLVDPEKTRAWCARAPSELVERAEFPGHYHELFNEVGKAFVLERTAAFLDAVRTRRASGISAGRAGSPR